METETGRNEPTPFYVVVDQKSTTHILPHNLIKDILVDLIERISKEKVLLILYVMIGMLFSPLMQLEIIIYGHVRKCVKLSSFS